MEVVRPGFGQEVDLRRSQAPLVRRIRGGVDRDLLHGTEAQLQVGGARVVEVQERVVGIQPVNGEVVGDGR